MEKVLLDGNKRKPSFERQPDITSVGLSLNAQRDRRAPSNIEGTFSSEVLYIKMISHGTGGGRKFRYNATVIVGDGTKSVGLCTAKANTVREAVDKSTSLAKKQTTSFSFGNSITIPFEVTGKYHTTKVILRPAKDGHGLIAGMIVRSILRFLGVRNISAKVHGSRHRRSVALATLDALQKIDQYKDAFDSRTE